MILGSLVYSITFSVIWIGNGKILFNGYLCYIFSFVYFINITYITVLLNYFQVFFFVCVRNVTLQEFVKHYHSFFLYFGTLLEVEKVQNNKVAIDICYSNLITL